ncbi:MULTISPECIES: hypothetical protein [unclassified Streptomyces]|uniref:hypothetical protein n=1 Tax=Streptomyces TaxID=1883 RepID=UPI0013721D66|nr:MULTISPECIES: hypothetical protein [unclassified Streptomyces]NEA05083.1 hypothetical protein [Streptomyces sp. SID10116]MYY80891.1 hypothetical protein [Streptomyces sp. SID335]MYY87114.1 hypothetical protein [Streptomyces sp. SID335]MYZ12412.1 hypothetical protein [Streptomyces sp. SID337]NDZ89465.1 hypothetical protein [Streptomyces sp. SID10115]
MTSLQRRFALAAAGLAVVAGASWSVCRTTDTAATASAGEAVTLYDVRDARQVAGTADDVFAGTVVGRAGQRDIVGIPSDLYEVRVERSFKGGPPGTVTVSHEQGAPPLTTGGAYVFATGRVPDERTHAVLLETTPAPYTSLTAPARVHGPSSDTAGPTVAEHWAWAVDHETDVTDNG